MFKEKGMKSKPLLLDATTMHDNRLRVLLGRGLRYPSPMVMESEWEDLKSEVKASLKSKVGVLRTKGYNIIYDIETRKRNELHEKLVKMTRKYMGGRKGFFIKGFQRPIVPEEIHHGRRKFREDMGFFSICGGFLVDLKPKIIFTQWLPRPIDFDGDVYHPLDMYSPHRLVLLRTKNDVWVPTGLFEDARVSKDCEEKQHEAFSRKYLAKLGLDYDRPKVLVRLKNEIEKEKKRNARR